MFLLIILQFFAIITLIYFNRGLYWRSLLLEAQLRVVRKKYRRRFRFSENFRRIWVWASRLHAEWKSVCILAKPSTVLDWHHRRFASHWTLKSRPTARPPGRQPISEEERNLIARYAKENPRWGPAQIQGRLFQDHGYRRHIDTVRKHMPKRNPDPRATLRWREFMRLHMPDTVAMDFFLIKRAVSKPLLVFVMLHHESRKILHINLCESPTADWLKQQLLLALPDVSGISRLLCDNDPLFFGLETYAREMFEINIARTQPRSPYQNPFAERVIRTIREELTDFMLPISKRILLQRLLEYKEYYNQNRTHTSLSLETPANSENARPGPDYHLFSKPVLGGLHHTYHWRKAA